MRLVWLLLLVPGCELFKIDGPATTCGAEYLGVEFADDALCLTEIVSTYPSEGALLDPDRTLRVEFSDGESRYGGVCIAGVEGVPLASSVRFDESGREMTVSLDEPLTEGSYSMWVGYSCGAEEIAFEVGGSGADGPVDTEADTDEPDGEAARTWVMSTDGVQYEYPSGYENLIGPLIESSPRRPAVLVAPGATPGSLDLTLGTWGTESPQSSQDACAPTTFTGDVSSFDGVASWTTSGWTQLWVLGSQVVVPALELELELDEQASPPTLRVSSLVDMSDARTVEALGDDGCDVLETFSLSCTGCGDGRTTCYREHYEGTLEQAPGDLVKRTERMVEEDVGCEP